MEMADMQETMVTGVALKRMPAFRVAYVEHRGPYEEIGFAFQRLLRLLRERRLYSSGPMIALYYAPEEGSTARPLAEAAVPILGDFRPDNELRQRDVPAAEVGSMIYEGPPCRYSDCLDTLHRWAEDNGYVAAGPVREVYAKDLSELPPGILYVEVQLPVKRRRRA